jgi:hypothetical protein
MTAAKRKGKAKPKAKQAHPTKALTVRTDEVANYARLGAPDTEIGQMVGLSPRQLVRRFGPAMEKGRAERKLKLRQKQTEVALDGNVTMLIWLGKQELGQRDSMTTLPIDLKQMNPEQLKRLVAGDDPVQVLASPKGPTA